MFSYIGRYKTITYIGQYKPTSLKSYQYYIYLAPQPWVIDFDDYSFKRCHLCLGVRQKNFRPINMHIACRMQEKLCFSSVLFRKRVITSGFLRVKG